jgi:hypothetical protein
MVLRSPGKINRQQLGPVDQNTIETEDGERGNKPVRVCSPVTVPRLYTWVIYGTNIEQTRNTLY